MNWKKSLFKPKWQHKNPELRAEAVAEEYDPDLMEALPVIAGGDEVANVRAAAARRLNDPLRVRDLLGREKDKDVQDVLLDRLRYLLLHPGQAVGDADSRVQALESSDHRELLEAVAASAPEPELRKAALLRVERPGFLGDRAIHDPDPDLRRLAAGRIEQISTLKRVIEATRTTDKQLHLQLAERLHRALLDQGDPEAVRREALDICQSLESFLRAARPPSVSEVDELEQRWKTLGDGVTGDLATRFEADLSRLRSPASDQRADPGDSPAAGDVGQPPQPHEDESSEDAELHPGLQEAWRSIEAAVKSKKPVAERRIQALARNWKNASATAGDLGAAGEALKSQALDALEKLRDAARKANEQREQWVDQASQHLADLQAALDAGELHHALEERAALQNLKQNLAGSKEWKGIQSRLSSVQGRLRELRDWQHWANDKIRKRLIEEMETLPATGLHPDAVLEKIKALQAEWKRLEASEQIPGDRHYAAAPWMWRKFNAAGKAAFELTKPFLDKRSELRSQNLEKIRQTATDLEDLCQQEDIDQRELGRRIGRARKALRSLDSIPARNRHKTAEMLKQALGKGNDAKRAAYSAIEKQKMKLVREAAQLQHMADRAEAIALAKSLQSQWKAAGSLWRSRENELWDQFRAPIDPLFADLEAERETVRAEQAERLSAQEQLCIQLESLLEAGDAELADQHGRVQGLVDDWQQYRKPDRRFKARFDKAYEQYQQREAAFRNAAVREQKVRWWNKAEILHQLGSAIADGKLTPSRRTKLEAQWSGQAGDSHPVDEELDRRFRALAEQEEPTQEPDSAAALESARKICIGLEFLAGLPSPEEEKDIRMQYQVERLSASMTGERERVPAVEEARQLEKEWLLHAYIPDTHYPLFQQRVRGALDKVLEE